MIKKILLTSTSFADTPGAHREYLKTAPIEIVETRGPHTVDQLHQILDQHGLFDGYLIGEDSFTTDIIERISPRAKVISRYGVGLDAIDVETAEKLGIKIFNTPRQSHTAVAEHTFGLLFSLCRKIPEHNLWLHSAIWNRKTGLELAGKTIAILGFGHVGREVAKKAVTFGMSVIAVNRSWSEENLEFANQINQLANIPILNINPNPLSICQKPEDALEKADIISIHMDVSKKTENFFDRYKISLCKKGALILNLSRGQLIDCAAMAEAILSGQIAGFAADVIHPQPITAENPLLGLPNVILTPHIASRTFESVTRQGLAAAENLLLGL